MWLLRGPRGGLKKKFSRLAIARHIFRPPHKLCYNSTTAHLVTSTRHSDHITGAPSATLATVHQRVDLKVATLFHRSLSGICHRLAFVAIIPSRRMPSCRRCSWAIKTFHSWPSIVTQTYSNFGDKSIRSWWTRTMEQFPLHMKEADLSHNEFWRCLSK